MLLEQGNHFAKSPGAMSAPPAVDVCPAVIYHRHTEADWDPILPGAWRGGGSKMWHSAALGCKGSVRSEGAMGSWCRRRRGPGADGMSPHPQSHTQMVETLLLRGYLWAKAEKTISHISVALSTQPGPYLAGNLLKVRSKRDEFLEEKPVLFLHRTCRNIVYLYLKTLIQEACVLPKSH